jgi:diketogulonate reductase-like aldo/keto reductase
VYSHGLSEVTLGKAIKQHKLPRDEIVVMTKVFPHDALLLSIIGNLMYVGLFHRWEKIQQ